MSGNTFAGICDSASDSTAGRMIDALLSKITGIRTVGNDFKQTSAYAKGAKDAAAFASLCVELNIPIETDAQRSLDAVGTDNAKYMGKTFTARGNVGERILYAYQKYMSYALEVTDKIFEGGANAAVTASLDGLKGLSAEDASNIAEFTANRRTFKNATWEDAEGNTHGSYLARKTGAAKQATGVVGDWLMPFSQVPANATQTAIDYTVGVAKGTGEIISIVKDSRAGKTIDPVRQRQAASDFGRGMTGLGMIGLFTCAAAMGIVDVSDDKDKDKKALEQSDGRYGAQINWSALERALCGESTTWKDGDITTSLDFLEPFNTQMYLGYELSQEETMAGILKAAPGATFNSIWASLMDSPMMTSANDAADAISDLMDAESATDVADTVVDLSGDFTRSFIPQAARQAAQATGEYRRDTRGETAIDTAINKLLADIPVLNQTLPIQYSGVGEPQRYGKDKDIFADPTYTGPYNPDAVTTYLRDLSENLDGDASFYPDSQAPMSVNIDGQKVALDGSQRQTWQQTYGTKFNEIASQLTANPGFRQLPSHLQAEALSTAKEYATQYAKEDVFGNGNVPEGTAEEIASSLVGKKIAGEFNGALDELRKNWKNTGDIGDAAQEMEEAMELYQSMDEGTKAAADAEIGGISEAYLAAKDAGMDTETFATLYLTYREVDGAEGKPSEQAQAWHTALERAEDQGMVTAKQKETMRENMKFWQIFPAETEKFDALISTGINTEDANKVVTDLGKVQGTGAVNAETGKTTVRPIDKWRAIVAMDYLDDTETDTVMKEYFTSDAQEKKYNILREHGYSAEDFVDAYGVTQEYSKKLDRIKGFMELGYDWSEAQALYELFRGDYDRWN